MAKPVFDHYSRGTPPILPPEIRSTMEDALAECDHIGEMFERMQEKQLELIRSDPSIGEQLREAYAEASVNLVSPTMSSVGLRGVDDATAPERVRVDLARWQGLLDAVDWLHKVTTPDDARAVIDQGDVGVVLNTQNLARLIEDDIDEIDVLHNFGMELMQLTYNAQTLLGTGCTDRSTGGLSSLGVQAVNRINELEIMIDLAHCNRQTTLDTMEVSDDPVMFSHSFCEDISGHPRGKSDAELRRLRETDGYIGIIAMPKFLTYEGQDDEWAAFFEHIEHALDIVGIDNVGIGSDFGSWNFAGREDTPEEIKEGIVHAYNTIGVQDQESVAEMRTWSFGPIQEYTDFHKIPSGLRERGYTEDEVDKIMGENFLSYWERVKS